MELRDFKDGGWGWYNHKAFEIAASFGYGTLAVYMALTKLESIKRGSRGFIVSVLEIAQTCNMSKRAVSDKLHELQGANLVLMERHSAQCFMYKLMPVPLQNLHGEVQNLHGEVQDLHRIDANAASVYSVAKKNKSNIIPAPPGALEIIFDGREQKYSAPAHSLAASADAEKNAALEAAAKRARIESLEALENS